ncbi:MAG: metallophosphoesterase [Ramlibacter sp.]
MKRLLAVVGGLVLLLAVWSVGIEPRWVAARRIEHKVPGWHGPPLKVAVASDWHISRDAFWRVMTAGRAGEIVDAINAANPDVVLLPGDSISGVGDPRARGEIGAEKIAAVPGRLRALLGVYAVMGNHDWWGGAPQLAAALERRGIHVLENTARPIDAGLWVAGIGDEQTGHARAQAALAAVPPRAQVLVLMHDPGSLRRLPPVRGLVVAGHTHGGQVALPFLGPLVVPRDLPRSWTYGWVEHAGQQAWVTSGLGVSILPVRFNRRPEWVLFVLDAAVG